MRHNQPLQWKKEEPIFCRKAFTDWVRGYTFLSAKPACSSLLLASPVLPKVPSGILSWFKSCFTSCSVIVFWGQHNAVRVFVGVFFPLWYPCFESSFYSFGSALQSHSVHFYSYADVTWSNLLFCLLHCSFYFDQLFLFSNVYPTVLRSTSWTKLK